RDSLAALSHHRCVHRINRHVPDDLRLHDKYTPWSKEQNFLHGDPVTWFFGVPVFGWPFAHIASKCVRRVGQGGHRSAEVQL
ncbi:MAG: hypothetical protein QGI13_12525, partial [Rhodospirillales bacterium]|nr:hypothetical protein [Rhodospirillales bacterium]